MFDFLKRRKKPDYTVEPKFCPNGCGKTITARRLSWEECERAKQQGVKCTPTNSWLIDCTKCKYSTVIMHRETRR